LAQGKTATFYHHRLLALAFVHRPPRHFEKTFDELEVNHIDGDKWNNDLSNLEWCTPEENVDHAIRLGLYTHEVILARNILDNSIKRFLGVTGCSRAFNIDHKRLRRHVESRLAGYVTCGWHVFKYDDKKPWPRLEDEHYQENTWEKHFGMWVAKKVTDPSKIIISSTVAGLSQMLQIPYHVLRKHLRNKTDAILFDEWVCSYDEFSVERANDRASIYIDRVIFPPKDVTVKNRITGEIQTFASRNIAATSLGVHPDRIRYALKAKGGVIGDLQFIEA